LNKYYPYIAYAAALGLELVLWFRLERFHRIKDFPMSDSGVYQNLGIMGLTMLLLAPVVRHGSSWQRGMALIFLIWPLIYVIGGYEFAFGLL
jgi:hypothetical protein